MADQNREAEAKDRGLFEFMKKEEAVVAAEFEQKVQVVEAVEQPKVAEEEEENKKHYGLLYKLQQSDSSSSSSDEEGGAEGEEKKKIEKKKKEGEETEKNADEDATAVPIEKCEEEKPCEEQKEGLLDKLKEKLPGYGNKKKLEEQALRLF